MVTGWNTSVGSLKSELEALRLTVDRAGGMHGEIQVLRDMVDRNAGIQVAARREQDMLRSTVERMANSGSGSMSLDPIEHSLYRPSSRATTPLPFAQGIFINITICPYVRFFLPYYY